MSEFKCASDIQKQFFESDDRLEMFGGGYGSYGKPSPLMAAVREFRRMQEEYYALARPIMKEMASLEIFRPIAFIKHEDGRLEPVNGKLPLSIQMIWESYVKMLEELKISVFGADPNSCVTSDKPLLLQHGEPRSCKTLPSAD